MDITSIKKVPYSSGDETSSTSSEVDMDEYTIAREQKKQNLDEAKTETNSRKSYSAGFSGAWANR